MRLDPSHPANRGVLQALSTADSSTPDVMTLKELDDSYAAYFQSGSHPDIVSHVWDHLGKSFPGDCCCLLNGTPVLIHDQAGVVLAICYGTEYVIRVPEEMLPEALAAGCQQVCTWGGVEQATDLREELGPDWVFGCFAKGEQKWFQATCKQYSESGRGGLPGLQVPLPQGRPTSEPRHYKAKAGRMILRTNYHDDPEPKDVATDPSESDVAAAVRSMDWNRFAFVTLFQDAANWLDGSGCLAPDFGLSMMLSVDDIQYVTETAPTTPDAMLEIFNAYLAGDEDRLFSLIYDAERRGLNADDIANLRCQEEAKQRRSNP